MLPIALIFWPFLETIIKNNKNLIVYKKYNENDLFKINSQFISGFHALSIIIFGFVYLFTQSNYLFLFIFFFSIIYFIYDSYSIWFNKITDYYPYLIHHGASIYFLQCLFNYQGNVKSKMILGYVFIEITNLPSYFIYYFLKTNDNKNEKYYKKLLNLKLIQLVLYIIFRLFIFGYLMKYCYSDIKHQPVLTFSILGLYLMGVYWSFHLTQGYLKTKTDFNNLISKKSN